MARRRTPAGLVQGDSVDELLADWSRERPDLDVSPIAIVVRLARIRAHLDAATQHVFDEYDLSAADFVALVSLRREGPPYRLTQVQLVQRLALTSGTVSVRIDRLVRRGVVVREADDVDRRVQWVRLTPLGMRLFDEIAPAHLMNEDRLLSALTAEQRVQLADLLRVLLVAFEQETFPVPVLGIALLAAHEARARRAAVGLSDITGVLVAAPPERGSPAARAGLRQGDLITAVDGVPVRGADVAAAFAVPQRGSRDVAVAYVRGERRRRTSITLTR